MKVRKIFLSPILMMAITSMSGCFNPFAKVEGFKIYWKNYDGSILEIDTMKSRLDMPQYDGNIPTKPTDDAATYTFAEKPLLLLLSPKLLENIKCTG